MDQYFVQCIRWTKCHKERRVSHSDKNVYYLSIRIDGIFWLAKQMAILVYKGVLEDAYTETKKQYSAVLPETWYAILFGN